LISRTITLVTGMRVEGTRGEDRERGDCEATRRDVYVSRTRGRSSGSRAPGAADRKKKKEKTVGTEGEGEIMESSWIERIRVSAREKRHGRLETTAVGVSRLPQNVRAVERYAERRAKSIAAARIRSDEHFRFARKRICPRKNTENRRVYRTKTYRPRRSGMDRFC